MGQGFDFSQEGVAAERSVDGFGLAQAFHCLHVNKCTVTGILMPENSMNFSALWQLRRGSALENQDARQTNHSASKFA